MFDISKINAKEFSEYLLSRKVKIELGCNEEDKDNFKIIIKTISDILTWNEFEKKLGLFIFQLFLN